MRALGLIMNVCAQSAKPQMPSFAVTLESGDMSSVHTAGHILLLEDVCIFITYHFECLHSSVIWSFQVWAFEGEFRGLRESRHCRADLR